MKDKIRILFRSGAAAALGLSVLLTLAIETLGRHSLLQGLGFLRDEPRLFLYNSLLVFVTLVPALLLRRRAFYLVVASLLWLGMGVTNGVVLSFRMTPFTASDLSLLENGLSILPNYLSVFQMVLVALAALAVAALLVLAFLFAPKRKGPMWYKTNALFVALAILAFYGITSLGIQDRWLATYFSNLGYAYRDYGVSYGFMNTWLNRGIPVPVPYTESKILAVFPAGIPAGIGEANPKLAVDTTAGETPKRTPNILYVQLESFIDPLEIEGLELSADPAPNFRKLKEEASSGYLLVPSVGAGTANTEFEVLTGMRIKSFGPGEYPYKTILKEATCETVNYVLDDYGYTSHAIHNHRGAFYNRNTVFANLGFDTFTSIEYMNNVRLTPKNWAKDKILTKEILAALDSTEGPDFVFTISVQGHGRYPEDPLIPPEDLAIRVLSGIDEEEERNATEYYLQQIWEMDRFIADLLAAVEKRKEDTVVVFYGDHLPVLGLATDDLQNHSLYETEYVLWSNFGLKEIDTDLAAFQLSAQVLERLGMERGILPWFHQTRKTTPGYLSQLESLQYDMLYGQNYIFGGAAPFRPSDLQMGVREIRVEKIFPFEGNTYVVGENFTPYSKLAVNGEFVDTIFVHSQLLKVEESIDSTDPNDYSISQVGKYNTVLSTLEDVE